MSSFLASDFCITILSYHVKCFRAFIIIEILMFKAMSFSTFSIVQVSSVQPLHFNYFIQEYIYQTKYLSQKSSNYSVTQY